MMTLTAVSGFLLVMAASLHYGSALLPGLLGGTCKPTAPRCISANQQICEDSICRIKHGNGCERTPDSCVTGASCTSGVCACDSTPQQDGSCALKVMTTGDQLAVTSQMSLTSMTTTTPEAANTTTPSGSAHFSGNFQTVLTQVLGLLCVLFL